MINIDTLIQSTYELLCRYFNSIIKTIKIDDFNKDIISLNRYIDDISKMSISLEINYKRKAKEIYSDNIDKGLENLNTIVYKSIYNTTKLLDKYKCNLSKEDLIKDIGSIKDTTKISLNLLKHL